MKPASAYIRDKLEKSKAAYVADMEKYREAVTAFLDKREEAARKNGNKKPVDQIKAERQAFEEKSELPESTTAVFKAMRTNAQSSLETAYSTAVREYTKSKQDDEAAEIEKELDRFKAGPLAVSEMPDEISTDGPRS